MKVSRSLLSIHQAQRRHGRSRAALKPVAAALLASGLALSGTAQAALHDRGSGLIYDDVLNITWLQDANYAKTSGYDADGYMNWGQAVAWADNLVYHDSLRNVDYSDWRLPTVSPINGTVFNYGNSVAGNTDVGYNVSAPGTAYAGAIGSELAYAYHNNLGLKGVTTPTGAVQADFGIFGNGTTVGQNNVGLIDNLQANWYWSGTEYAPDIGYAWGFYLDYGFQSNLYKSGNSAHAWAVRPGDVVAVPEADTWALLLAGLGVLAGAARRRESLSV